jgi:hypothetical protein
MRLAIAAALLLVAACGQQKKEPTAPTARVTPAALPAKSAPQSKMALWIPIPKDKAQLQRLLAMGYKIHEDHLHAPGVTGCPKMSEDPVK